ncbi:unnamed protein product [Trichobilharzia regenti]|nr:unnamed protein product [Trichobilharzia regenti]
MGFPDAKSIADHEQVGGAQGESPPELTPGEQEGGSDEDGSTIYKTSSISRYIPHLPQMHRAVSDKLHSS